MSDYIQHLNLDPGYNSDTVGPEAGPDIIAPCDGCTHNRYCGEERKACHQYDVWHEFGRYDLDLAREPSSVIYKRIFDNPRTK